MIQRVRGLYERFVSGDPMFRNSMAIMCSTAVTSLFGYIFWIIVARAGGAEAAGIGAAITSAMQATVLFASAGGPNALIEQLPGTTSARDWREKYTAIALAAASMAGLCGLLVAVALGTGGVLPSLGSPFAATTFVVLCALMAWCGVLDATLLCEYRSTLLVSKNLILTGLRIPFYLAFVVLCAAVDSVLFAWTLGACVAVPFTLVAFGVRNKHSLVPLLRGVRGVPRHLLAMRHSIVGQHMIVIGAQLPTFLLPILVVARLTPADNAYFYAAWMLGGIFLIISPAVSMALFVEGAGARAPVAELATKALRTIGLLLILPVLGYLVAGALLLSMFGPEYPQHAQLLLTVLTLSALPDAVTNVAVAVLRITDRIRSALWLNWLMLAGTLGGAWLLMPTMGITGAGLAWLLAQSAGAIWVALRWKWVMHPPVAHTVDDTAADEPAELVEPIGPLAVGPDVATLWVATRRRWITQPTLDSSADSARQETRVHAHPASH